MPPAKRPNARAKGEGSVYQIKSGDWVASIGLPSPDGRRRQVTRQRKTEAGAKEQLTQLRRKLIQDGDIPTSGQTLESWLGVWFRDIELKKINPKSAASYRSMIRLHIIPSIGRFRLDKLTPAHVRKLHDDMAAKGLSTSSALKAHVILAGALKAAEREGRVTRNVTTLTDAPRVAVSHLEALDAEQGMQVLAVAADEPWGSLWWAVLLTGARQGELLGLETDRVDFTTNTILLSWQLQRLTWEHGCGGTCERKRGTDCPSRKITAPSDWEHRHIVGGLWMSRPKSRAGWRTVPLVEPLRSVLLLQVQANTLKPNPHNLIWSHPDGSPIDPRIESEAWDALLKLAKVPDVRLHDGRHTTVDLLYLCEVPEAVISEIVGHSTGKMTRKYRARKISPAHIDAMERLSVKLTTKLAIDPPSTPALDLAPPPE